MHLSLEMRVERDVFPSQDASLLRSVSHNSLYQNLVRIAQVPEKNHTYQEPDSGSTAHQVPLSGALYAMFAP